MTTINRPETAKIYEFRPRSSNASGSGPNALTPSAGLPSKRLPVIEFGSSWYHEAAVQDAERIRKQ